MTERDAPIFARVSSLALDEVPWLAPIVFIATKSYDIPALLEGIAPKDNGETLYIVVQNGFAAYDMVSGAVGRERTAMGVLYVGAQIISPGVIDIKPGIAQLFLPSTYRKQLSFVVDALESGGMEAALVDDIDRRMWMKQLFLVPFAIINTEMHQPIGKVYEDAGARQRWGQIALEMATIATACGVSMPVDPAAASLAVAERFDPQADLPPSPATCGLGARTKPTRSLGCRCCNARQSTTYHARCCARPTNSMPGNNHVRIAQQANPRDCPTRSRSRHSW